MLGSIPEFHVADVSNVINTTRDRCIVVRRVPLIMKIIDDTYPA